MKSTVVRKLILAPTHKPGRPRPQGHVAARRDAHALDRAARPQRGCRPADAACAAARAAVRPPCRLARSVRPPPVAPRAARPAPAGGTDLTCARTPSPRARRTTRARTSSYNMPEDKVEVRINQAINFIESHELCPTTFKPLQLKRSGVSQPCISPRPGERHSRRAALAGAALGCSRRRARGACCSLGRRPAGAVARWLVRHARQHSSPQAERPGDDAARFAGRRGGGGGAVGRRRPAAQPQRQRCLLVVPRATDSSSSSSHPHLHRRRRQRLPNAHGL